MVSKEEFADFWEKILKSEPDNVPLSDEERHQLECEDFVTWDELKDLVQKI